MTLNLTALRLRLTEEQMYIRQQLGKFLADSNTATAKSTEELEALMIKDRQAFRNTLKQKRRDELASGYAYGKVTPVR
jgi:C4-dicarboxylate-specific signal transduction histidine kinase